MGMVKNPVTNMVTLRYSDTVTFRTDDGRPIIAWEVSPHSIVDDVDPDVIEWCVETFGDPCSPIDADGKLRHGWGWNISWHRDSLVFEKKEYVTMVLLRWG